jgi:hypothetical protein
MKYTSDQSIRGADANASRWQKEDVLKVIYLFASKQCGIETMSNGAGVPRVPVSHGIVRDVYLQCTSNITGMKNPATHGRGQHAPSDPA